MEKFNTILVAGLAVGTLSTTIAKSRVFRRVRIATKGVPFLGELVLCPYCLGHWFSWATLPVCFGLTYPCLLDAPSSVVLWLAVTGVAGIVSGALCLSLEVMDRLH